MIVTNFKPISLITSLYKIIAKVLRLRDAHESNILDEYAVFVKSRQILDVVLVVNKVVEKYRRNNETALIFKIDFEKA